MPLQQAADSEVFGPDVDHNGGTRRADRFRSSSTSQSLQVQKQDSVYTAGTKIRALQRERLHRAGALWERSHVPSTVNMVPDPIRGLGSELRSGTSDKYLLLAQHLQTPVTLSLSDRPGEGGVEHPIPSPTYSVVHYSQVWTAPLQAYSGTVQRCDAHLLLVDPLFPLLGGSCSSGFRSRNLVLVGNAECECPAILRGPTST